MQDRTSVKTSSLYYDVSYAHTCMGVCTRKDTHTLKISRTECELYKLIFEQLLQ